MYNNTNNSLSQCSIPNKLADKLPGPNYCQLALPKGDIY